MEFHPWLPIRPSKRESARRETAEPRLKSPPLAGYQPRFRLREISARRGTITPCTKVYRRKPLGSSESGVSDWLLWLSVQASRAPMPTTTIPPSSSTQFQVQPSNRQCSMTSTWWNDEARINTNTYRKPVPSKARTLRFHCFRASHEKAATVITPAIATAAMKMA